MPEGSHVSALFVYPVKGCRGMALERSPIAPHGLAYDREWLVVDRDGGFITQRPYPRLSQVRTMVGEDGLRLSAPGVGAVTVPLDQTGERVAVRIWRDDIEAVRQSPEADAFFSELLGAELHLVRFAPDVVRGCQPKYTQPGDHTFFADSLPLLVTTEASLARLNEVITQRGGAAVPMSRFRPNIVVTGTTADVEDRCQRLVVDDSLTIDLVKPCSRCQVTTINQESGDRMGKEPLASLATYRQGLLGEADKEVYFGQNGVARVSDSVPNIIAVGAAARFVAR